MPMIHRILLSLVLLMASFWSAPLHAAIRNNLKCSASISGPMTFAGSALGDKQLETNMDIKLFCEDSVIFGAYFNTHFYVCVDIGTGSGGVQSGKRQLSNGTDKLDFQIYKDAAHLNIWGDTAGSLGTPVDFGKFDLSGNGRVEKTITTPASGVLFSKQIVNTGKYVSNFNGELTVRWIADPTPATNCNSRQPDEQSSTTSFSVTYTAESNCQVSASTLDFGPVGLLHSKKDAEGSIGVACTKGTPYSIALGNGNWGTDAKSRKMAGPGAEKIAYELYRDKARSLIWGSTKTDPKVVSPGDDIFGGTGKGNEAKIPVYGRIPVQESVGIGDYSDSVVVTVTY